MGQQTLPSSQEVLLDGAGGEQWFSPLSGHQNNLEGALVSRLLGSPPPPLGIPLTPVSFQVWGGELGICISIAFPGDVDPAGLGHLCFLPWRAHSLDQQFSIPGVMEGFFVFSFVLGV